MIKDHKKQFYIIVQAVSYPLEWSFREFISGYRQLFDVDFVRTCALQLLFFLRLKSTIDNSPHQSSETHARLYAMVD